MTRALRRYRLKPERPAIVHEVTIYPVSLGTDEPPKPINLRIRAGMYADGRIGELFIRAEQEGSVEAGFLQVISVLTSLLLQYGVPAKVVADKLFNMRFSPSGATSNESIPRCHSLVDYVARWLMQKTGNGSDTKPGKDLTEDTWEEEA